MLHVDSKLKEIVKRQLAERSERVPGAPERPITTVKSQALFDLQFRATVEGHEFISDEREAAGGHDAGPAPLRYFLGGIMMCHQVWTVKSSAIMDLTLGRLEGEISGYNAPGGGGFAKITYTVSVDSDHTDAQVAEVVQLGAERCAAFVTVQKATRVELTIKHNGNTILERTYGG